MLRLASLCSGYGGLELALRILNVDFETVWFAEVDAKAAQVMASHHPGVPNLGDIRLIEDAPSVDVVTAGFPCQPVSQAGKGKGIDDERWLIDDVCRVASRVGAQWLILENVPGILGANQGLAFSRVASALAENGFSAEWTCVRASDVGAPHKRLRWFCIGYTDSVVGEASEAFSGGSGTLGEQGEVPRVVGSDGSSGSEEASDAYESGGKARCDSGCSRKCARKEPVGHTSSSSDTDCGGYGAQEDCAGVGRVDGSHEDVAQDGERTREILGHRGEETIPHAGRFVKQVQAQGQQSAIEEFGSDGEDGEDAFGPYQQAVIRWEWVLGRYAPCPVDEQSRLNPCFVEWMMGVPEGWVCDAVEGRTHQLKILGNGVVPLQAAFAIEMLLDQIFVA